MQRGGAYQRHLAGKEAIEIHKIFTALRSWLTTLVAVECPPDPLARMSVAELADLPANHPRRDDGCAC